MYTKERLSFGSILNHFLQVSNFLRPKVILLAHLNWMISIVCFMRLITTFKLFIFFLLWPVVCPESHLENTAQYDFTFLFEQNNYVPFCCLKRIRYMRSDLTHNCFSRHLFFSRRLHTIPNSENIYLRKLSYRRIVSIFKIDLN